MEQVLWMDIKELCERLQHRGFSFQVYDYLALKKALPELLEVYKKKQKKIEFGKQTASPG